VILKVITLNSMNNKQVEKIVDTFLVKHAVTEIDDNSGRVVVFTHKDKLIELVANLK